MYKLLTHAGFFATWLAVVVANPLSRAESGVQEICTLDLFVINSSGVLMCSESDVPLVSGVRSKVGEGIIVFYRNC